MKTSHPKVRTRYPHAAATRLAASCCVAAALCGPAAHATQDPPGSPAPSPAAVPNDQLAEVTTPTRVTQQYEIYNPHSAEQLRTVRQMGFTQVILDRPQLHAQATELGLDVVLANWWTLETELEKIEKAIDLAGQVDPRRLVAISMMDEPERYAPQTPFSYYRALYQDLRRHLDQSLPNVRLEISHWGPLSSWTHQEYERFVELYQAADRIRLMPYPDLREGPLNEVFYQMQRSRHLMQRAGRELPQVVILQTWALPEDPKLPTIAELRVMAYQALLAGADTVSFYNFDPALWNQTAGFTQGFTELMHELKEFSRRHRQHLVQARMGSQGVLAARLTSPAGKSTSILVNTNRHGTEGLPALAVVIDAKKVCATTGPACRPPRRLRHLLYRRRCGR